MRYLLLLLILVMSGCDSLAQKQTTNYELTIKSKMDSEIDIEYVIYYNNQNSLAAEDPIIKKINTAIKDSLHQFDMFELISTKRDVAQNLVCSIVKNEFKTNGIDVEDAILVKLEIPKEAKQLYFKLEKIKQSYLEVLLEIRDRKQLLEEELASNKNLSKTEIEEIKKELLILENYEYISNLYDKKLNELLFK